MGLFSFLNKKEDAQQAPQTAQAQQVNSQADTPPQQQSQANVASTQTPQATNNQSQQTNPANRTRPLILLIEDEALLVRMYSQKLQTDGFDVITATDGADGLFQAGESKPDLIVCDVMLPNKDGISILKELKANEATKQIPVIMLSNLSEQKYVDEALELGAVSYLVKSDLVPADVVKEIKEKLRAAGKESLLSN